MSQVQPASSPTRPLSRPGTAWLCWSGWRSTPTITPLLALGGGVIATWPFPLRTLALTVVAVPLMVFVLLPRLQRVLAPWLAR